jgi:glycosyltransferase involved in cell wall biosynthesis
MALLQRAVESVLAQSERDFEIIIVDDASTDGTARYLEELISRNTRVHVVRNSTPGGGAASRNAGIFRSIGKWIAFIDDDDEWLPAKLEQQLAALRKSRTAVACSCSWIVKHASGRSHVVKVPAAPTLRQLLADNALGGASMCVCSAQVVKQIGGFDVKFKSGQDMDLWVRLRQHGEILGCPEVLVLHWAHSGVRITTNMLSQYLGAKRFHFKHRPLMDTALRRQRMAYNCFIMSRQPTRTLGYRLRYLWLSLRSSSPACSFAYARSGGLRLLRDAVCRPLTQRNFHIS